MGSLPSAIPGAGIAAGVGGGLALAADAPGAAITFGRSPIFLAGVRFMWSGIALRQWAVAALGRFFSADVRVHPIGASLPSAHA